VANTNPAPQLDWAAGFAAYRLGHWADASAHLEKLAQNAGVSSTSSILFTPLTDSVAALSGILDASISIGALTVQPGTVKVCGTGATGGGVILAGTGDPNDALDSYYGAGILRSADGGNTWSLISSTSDHLYSFMGEGIAGFAWSTVNTDLVVAAGAELEVGWLPILLRESGNARIQPGNPGYFEATTYLHLLEIPSSVDRSMGDVHPLGNPHAHLDPHNVALVASMRPVLRSKLATFQPSPFTAFSARQK